MHLGTILDKIKSELEEINKKLNILATTATTLEKDFGTPAQRRKIVNTTDDGSKAIDENLLGRGEKRKETRGKPHTKS